MSIEATVSSPVSNLAGSAGDFACFGSGDGLFEIGSVWKMGDNGENQ